MSNPIFNMFNGGNNAMPQINQPLNPQNMLMNVIRQRNPQMFQQFQQLMTSGVNPQQLVQQQVSHMTPQQIQQVKNVGRQFGITDEQLSVFDTMSQVQSQNQMPSQSENVPNNQNQSNH